MDVSYQIEISTSLCAGFESVKFRENAGRGLPGLDKSGLVPIVYALHNLDTARSDVGIVAFSRDLAGDEYQLHERRMREHTLDASLFSSYIRRAMRGRYSEGMRPAGWI